MYPRLLKPPTRSFFLFGPRGVGKTTWLRASLPPDALRVDLLDSRVFLELSRDPSRLEARVASVRRGGWVVVDEVQKVPALLDEVQRLIESQGLLFALTGSSARKLKRGGANLLGGRAVVRAMEPLGFKELGKDFDADRAMRWGGLPLVHGSAGEEADLLNAYVHTYLKEEVQEEGLIRKVDPFVRFLQVAGILNGQILNVENVAREAGVPRASVHAYFSILEDTLLGYRLPAYQPGARVREVAHRKFYWVDPGIARAAAGLQDQPLDPAGRGFGLETWLLHELRLYGATAGKTRPISFHRTGAGVEVDFVVETESKTLSRKAAAVLIEVKASRKWDRRWGEAMGALAASKAFHVRSCHGVYLGKDRYRFGGVEVLPLADFLEKLYAGDVF